MSDELRFEIAHNIAKEAGGQFERQSANKIINESGQVVVGSAGVSNKIVQLADDAFKD